MFDAVVDKNLYGRSFVYSGLYFLGFGLIVQYYAYYLSNPELLVVYVPLYLGVIFFVASLFAKNLIMEFHPTYWWLAYLLLVSSAFAKAFAQFVPFENTFRGLLEFLFVLGVSDLAFLLSLITITVFGQRFSLRRNVGLSDNFFHKERNKWKSEVEGFPNFDKVLEGLDGGRFIAGLFDKGFFNLAILWSCNVMEEVIDAMTDGIIDNAPKNRLLFRTEEGRPKRYPLQIRNLGYESVPKHQKKKQFDVELLWHEIRRKIAHHNYRPTFEETNETLKILISFVRETPIVLQKWSSS